ncbi:Hypothetical protein CINCED_3A013702 [Cinara cedri]|nr:Hypothetical protein CINCED_3A013702 [Cinara cedri]
MSLQMPVTEDTPPDMLSGAMDLNVILPNGSVIKMSVERSTPMMDLLVQITTAHKLSPGSHAVHAIGDRGVLPYKPSTPIGALDTWTVNIVPKSSSKNGRYQNQPIVKCVTKPFEQTFRLQVHLPRNQLYVARISPKTQLSQILKQVCFEKNLDSAKYTLRKPDKLNEPLDLGKSLVDYKIQQLSLVLNTNRTLIGGLSSDDIMQSRPPKQFSCDDSLSSGSLGGRSLSPTRSDESSDTPRSRPLMVKVLPSRPVRKRRLAPKPPSQQRNASEQTIISHSRNSSDSSGYHESSVLSDAVDCSIGMARPGKLQSPVKPSGPTISRSMTNLQGCGKNQNLYTEIPFASNTISQSKHSVSTTSLISIQSRKKKAAPPPPPLANCRPKLAPPQEEPEREQEAQQRKSQTLPAAAAAKMRMADAQEKSKTVSRIELNNNVVVEPNLSPATSSLSSLSRSDVDRGNSTADEDDDLRMDDEEIDRIFGDATSGYDTPSIVTVRENNGEMSDIIDWEYKLPDPPSAFRDNNDRSPAVTVFDTVTIGNHLKDVVLIDEPCDGAAAASPPPPAESREDRGVLTEESVKKIIGDEYHCFPQDSGVGSDDSSLPSSCEEKLHADEKPAKTAAEPCKESKLNNFKIVAYDEDCGPTRPTEIFCDESVKTWKTTQMARESNPAYNRPPTGSSNPVNRHKSFSMDRTNLAVTVKRSTSHISLLSGNIKPSNRLAKHHYIGRTYSTERLDGYEDDRFVKRSFSVDNITEDVQESSQDDCENEIVPKKIEPTLEQTSPLHSLQILKSILPQIEDRKSRAKDEDKSFGRISGVPANATVTVPSVACPANGDGNRFGDDIASSATGKTVDRHPPCSRAGFSRSDHRAERPAADRQVPDDKKYSYAGPPKISLSTWNERPRRQVSIKTDRDYVVGVVGRYQQQLQQQQRTEQPKRTPETDGETAATSRVPPVVRSVELKKPYAERLLQRRTAASPALAALSEAVRAQAKLSNGRAADPKPAALEEKRQRFTYGKLTAGGRPARPRETAADPRETLLESIRSFGGRDNLRKIRA